MSKKETIAVVLLFSMTTILKICSVVALYSYKSHNTTHHHATYLAHTNTIENDLICAADEITAETQDDLGFKHTAVAYR